MIKDNDLIVVRNRNNGSTGYVLEDRGIRRSWEPNEIKKIPFEELKAFSYLNGGLYCLNNLLVIENKEALEALNMEVEPEYYYTEEDIRKMLFESNMDAFADFIDFAPEGAIEIAKSLAIKEQIPDIRKRDMLSKKTGLNINNAIMVNQIMDSEDDAEEEAPKQRRVQIEEKKPESTSKRRTSTPNYKVVSTK